MKLNYAVFSTIGTVRRKNQDNFFVNGKTKPLDESDMAFEGVSQEKSQLFAIADGMGGEQKGELAAFIAVERLKTVSIQDYYEDCLPYVEQVNHQICDYQSKHHLTMGSTIVALAVQADKIKIMNLGDSRLYHIQKDSITQLSKDHSEYQDLIDCGLLKKEDSAKHKSHNRLTQHFGIPASTMILEPHQVSVKSVTKGDYFLLCSDGLYSTVSDEQILQVITQFKAPKEICKQLVLLAEENKSRDNITAMVILVEDLSAPQAVALSQPNRSYVPHTQVKKKPLRPILTGVFATLGVISIACGGFLYLNPRIPDTVGQTEQVAVEALEKSGFNAMVCESFDNSIPEGVVMAQSTEAGGRCVRNSTIVLTVSKGIEQVEVICVEGMQGENAVKVLEIQGFKVSKSEEYSDTVENGFVICQSPNDGFLEKGSQIELTISVGREPISLPSLVGMNVNDAVAQLKNLGLTAEVIEKYDDNVTQGRIIEQSPINGTSLFSGEKVTLTSSKGQEMCIVPNVVGKSQKIAQQALEQVGLESQVKFIYSDTVTKGFVVYQSVSVGTQLKKGSTVGFSVSLGSRTR